MKINEGSGYCWFCEGGVVRSFILKKHNETM